MVALTGTASESVLRDIQRELDVIGEDVIVRPTKFDRDELKFEIVPVSRDKKKQQELGRLIAKVIPEKLGIETEVLADGTIGGIVFCPPSIGHLASSRLLKDAPQSSPVCIWRNSTIHVLTGERSDYLRRTT